jgi:hypothetical protein
MDRGNVDWGNVTWGNIVFGILGKRRLGKHRLVKSFLGTIIWRNIIRGIALVQRKYLVSNFRPGSGY